MDNIIILYSFYLAITICVTIWAARTLFRNGKLFLIDIFHGDKDLAQAVNNLLLVGFYLINIGYAVYTLRVISEVNTARVVIEVLSLKIGAIILILGCMHFLNMFIFFRLRKRALIEKRNRELGFE
ncbi:MAG: hypothetical protein BGO70_16710 [Bacteroidetes bacterium 43-93]|nr:hypothetical protein [Bacteroidota bacterium]OJX01402.1 MAG: hypothetical protein BGO70_16710 [Bacteroidetes bacterium 43-93]